MRCGCVSSTLRTSSVGGQVGGQLKAPKGGHRRLPNFGKAFEEGQGRGGRNPRQEMCLTFVNWCGRMWEAYQKKAGVHSHDCQQVILKVGFISIPTIEQKTGPGPSKTSPGRPPNPPKSSPGPSKIELGALQDVVFKRHLT